MLKFVNFMAKNDSLCRNTSQMTPYICIIVRKMQMRCFFFSSFKYDTLCVCKANAFQIHCSLFVNFSDWTSKRHEQPFAFWFVHCIVYNSHFSHCICIQITYTQTCCVTYTHVSVYSLLWIICHTRMVCVVGVGTIHDENHKQSYRLLYRHKAFGACSSHQSSQKCWPEQMRSVIRSVSIELHPNISFYTWMSPNTIFSYSVSQL